MYQKKGEITVLLSLIFVLLISFILTISESASMQMSKNMSRLNVDRAIFSVFGEYQKELLEEYEIFAFDSSYGSGNFSKELVQKRLAYYGSVEIDQEITDIQFLTDNQGQAFREAVLSYMESRTGIESLRGLTGLTQEWQEQSVTGAEISEEMNQSLIEFGDLLPEASSLIQGISGDGMFTLVLPDNFQISGKSIHLSQQIFGRVKNTGWGSFPARQNVNGAAEKILFQSYLLEKFSNAAEVKGTGRSLDYEIEYMLCGKESDKENLREVVEQILFFRLAMNYLYLQTDIDRQQEAATLATTLSIVILHPEMEEAIKQLLLVLWGFGESIMDVRSLLSGNKVPLSKSDETWQLTLSSLLKIGSSEDNIDGKDVTNGMSYSDYLQILLYLESGENLTMRALDRIEQNLMIEKGIPSIKMDHCVTKIKLSNTFKSAAGFSYTFPTYYGYL